jgi:ElaB/YqjD/DUF883 family membrane-anchored ribosome-binding protein
MIKSLVDVEDVLKNMASESVKQGENLRTAVRDLTLKALQQSGLAGEEFERSKAKKALDDLSRLEDEFLKTVGQASSNTTEKIRAQWASILKSAKLGGTEAGSQEAATVEAFGQRMKAAIREQRKDSLKTAYRLSQNFGTLASGVLIGLTEGLHQARPSKSRAAAKRKSAAKQRGGKSTKPATKKRTAR